MVTFFIIPYPEVKSRARKISSMTWRQSKRPVESQSAAVVVECPTQIPTSRRNRNAGLSCRRRSRPGLRQLAIRKKSKKQSDPRPSQVTLFARRLPQMPRPVRPAQHIHLHQLVVVRDVPHPRPFSLYKTRPSVTAQDHNGLASRVGNHESGRTVFKLLPDVP